MPAPNWQVTTLPVAGDWLGVEYGGGRLIAWQSFSNEGAYSDDLGATWHPLTLPSHNVTSAAYIAGVWLMISVTGTTDQLWKSTDGGITWVEATKPAIGAGSSEYYWKTLVYCNGRLYIFANGGTYNAYYTFDGSNWFILGLPFMGGVTSMAYGNGVYVAVQRGKNAHMFSRDGLNWQSIYMPSGTNGGMDVAFGNGAFIIPSSTLGLIARSTDGQNWESVTVGDGYWISIAFGAGTFVAVTNDTLYVYHSDDGENWGAERLTTAYFNDVLFINNVFIAMPHAYYGGNSAAALRAVYNLAPGTPSGITYGQPRAGEPLEIFTGGSLDPDGDAVTYVWERSTDVQNWAQIASGSALSIIDTVPTIGATIKYRVKAVDAHGAESEYFEGPIVSIYYNQPPTVPASISYAAPKADKVMAVTCTAVTDPENDAFSYVWERSIDGGTYSQAGITDLPVFNYTVPASGTTLALRVKVVDARGNESAYRTGSTLTISYNKAPTISGTDGNRGILTEPFSYAYFVTDTDVGDKITVVEKLDDVIIRTYTVTSGSQYTASISRKMWLALGNGIHTLTITATDPDGASATRTITFERYSGYIGLSRKFPTDTIAKKVYLSIFPKVDTSKAILSCLVCNNPYDDNPAWENITREVNILVHTFKNTTVETTPGIGYRFLIQSQNEEPVTFVEAVVRYA